MSQQEAVFGTARSSVVKSTYKHLSDVLSAYWSGTRVGNGLIDTIHNSPRLTQWAKTAEGYRIWSTDEALSVTVTPEKIYTTKGNRIDPVQDGLPAQTLYNAIQTAQAIVNTSSADEEEDEWFEEDEDFSGGAGLDAALAETHSEPLVEDDAELIEDVCLETISPTPDTSISMDTEPYDPERVYSQEVIPESFTAQANRKNAATDGVICSYCGNLNRAAYKGTCPKCPKQTAAEVAATKEPKKASKPESAISEAWLMARLKSLQGRVLTILDASPIADKAQRDAVKTLLNKEFRREMNKVSDGGWRQNDPRYEE
jgi:hypothetical protein